MNNHICIKPDCGNSYQDDDEDAYYCPSCVKEKAAIAKRIDATIRPRSRRVQSDLERFDAEAMNVRGIRCVKVSL